MTHQIFDFAVIGAGIAGASVAAELAQHASVLLIDMEQHAGYHSTGRSAAMFIPSYGPQPIQALTRASADFFNSPPEEFGNSRLLHSRGELVVARKDQMPELNEFYDDCTNNDAIFKLNAEQVQKHCPILKPGYAEAGVIDTSGCDIDVHTLHQGYLKQFKIHGGVESLNSRVQSLKRKDNTWLITAATTQHRAKTVINAAGAWADKLGTLAGAERIGLSPKRRTALTIEIPPFPEFNTMPLVADINEAFYIKPDAGHLLISPANEDPMEPCDVQPDELDIAICINEIENAFDIKVNNIISKWAGLRSFVADKSPVAGYSKKTEDFFWLAAQGGYGIQTSPALARYAAAIALGNTVPADITKQGLKPADVSVERLLN